MQKTLVAALALVFTLAACGLNRDAFTTLEGALKAIQEGDREKFKGYFLPGQDKRYDFVVRKLPFYRDMAQCWIEHDMQKDRGINKGAVLVLCKYTENRASLLYYYMTKKDGTWYIDFERTLEKNMEKGGSRFVVHKYEENQLKKMMETMEKGSDVPMKAESGN